MVCGRPCFRTEMFALTFNVAGTHTTHKRTHTSVLAAHAPGNPANCQFLHSPQRSLLTTQIYIKAYSKKLLPD